MTSQVAQGGDDIGAKARTRGPLLLLAEACHAAAETSPPLETDFILLTLVGGTIYEGFKAGVFGSELNLADILDSATLYALQRWVPLVPTDQLPTKITIGEFLSRMDTEHQANDSRSQAGAGSEGNHGSASSIKSIGEILDQMREMNAGTVSSDQPSTGEPASIAAVMGEYHARRAVEQVWDFLAPKHIDELPSGAAHIFVHQTSTHVPIRSLAADLTKASWVCKYLGSVLSKEVEKPSFLRIEEIREHYPQLNEREIEQVRKNLENWRNRGHEDKCMLSQEDPDTGR